MSFHWNEHSSTGQQCVCFMWGIRCELSHTYDMVSRRSSTINPRSHLAELFFWLFTIEKKNQQSRTIWNQSKWWKYNVWLLIRIFTNVFPIIWRFTTTVSEHFTDTLGTKQDSWGLIRRNENSFREMRKYFKIIYRMIPISFRQKRLPCRSVSDC